MQNFNKICMFSKINGNFYELAIASNIKKKLKIMIGYEIKMIKSFLNRNMN